MSLFGILNVSQRAMSASQLGVQVANHNIANINTPGYSRQELILTPARTTLTGFGELGNGVDLDRVRRVTDEFLQTALFREQSDFSGWSTSTNVLERVEILTGINEDSSMSASINDFFASFEKLATNPEDGSVRAAVVSAGVNMAERFRALSEGIGRVAADVDIDIDRQATRVNEILKDIAELNKTVISSDTKQFKSNDLKSRRDQLLGELSNLVQFTASEDKYGGLDIYVAGFNVVHRDSAVEFEPFTEDTNGEASLRMLVDGEHLSAERIGGSLGALIETRDGELASARESLDLLVGTMIERVNALHSSGFSPAGSGVDFFSGDGASDIRVTELLRNEPQFVASSYSTASGDNGLANDLAALADTSLPELSGLSVSRYFASYVGDIGGVTATARGMMQSTMLTRDELLTRVEGISGVSLDEEVANVTRYQAMYEASASMINTVNDMLDNLLSLGR